MQNFFLKRQYTNLSRPVKAGIWFTICNFLQRGIQFLVVPIYTRLLTPEGYGYYSIFIAWMNIVAVVATLHMSSGIYYNGMFKYESEGKQYTSSILSLGSLTTIILFLLSSFLFPFIENFVGLPYMMIVMMFIAILFSQALFFWAGQQRLQYKYKTLIIVTILSSVLAPFIALFCIMKLGMGYEAVIYGYVLSTLLFGGFLFIKLLKEGKIIYNRDYWNYSLSLSIPLLPHYLSLIVLGQLSRIMVQFYCGPSMAGIYSLAYQVSLIMNLIISGINSALTPWLYQNLKNKEYRKIKQTTTILILSISSISIVAMFVSPEIVRILGTEEYLQAVWIIPPILLSTIVTFIYSIFGTILFYFEKTNLIAIATTSGAILNVILNMIFIPRYGFIAAAYTTLISYVTLYLMYRFFSIQTCKNSNIDFVILFDLFKIRMALLILAIISLLSLAVFLLPFYLRYFLVLMIIILIYLNKSVVYKTIKNIKV